MSSPATTPQDRIRAIEFVEELIHTYEARLASEHFHVVEVKARLAGHGECLFETREDPPGSGNSVAWCLTHLCAHDSTGPMTVPSVEQIPSDYETLRIIENSIAGLQEQTARLRLILRVLNAFTRRRARRPPATY